MTNFIPSKLITVALFELKMVYSNRNFFPCGFCGHGPQIHEYTLNHET